MNLAMLAPASSIHTQRWANEMASRGHRVTLVSSETPLEDYDPQVVIDCLSIPRPWGYFLNAPALRARLRRMRPDILHTHYASGYGTLARLSGFHPCLLSVWGADVYEFPARSRFKRELLLKNLRYADQVASTSRAMKKQTELLFSPSRPIQVTPFGVDTMLFASTARPTAADLTIGTVKSLAPKYGIDLLLRTFRLVLDRLGPVSRLVVVGGGPQERELRELSVSLAIGDRVTFVGPVAHRDVPHWLNELDIYCALSTQDSESFGVAAVEASACELPVVVSDVGGLPEVVKDGVTGFVVPNGDIEAAADRIVALAQDRELRRAIGRAGRAFVLDEYDWKKNADGMEQIYRTLLHKP